MKRHFFTLLVCVAPLLLPAQQKADGLIWSKKGLGWEHFREVEGIGAGHTLARINWMLYIEISDSIVIQGVKKGAQVKIYALMFPSLSLVKESGDRTGVLEHEQIHFDNVELAARHLRKAIAGTVFNSKDYAKKIMKLYRKEMVNLNNRQDKYDETHREKKKGHNWWRAELDKELAELENYSGTEVLAIAGDLY